MKSVKEKYSTMKGEQSAPKATTVAFRALLQACFEQIDLQHPNHAIEIKVKLMERTLRCPLSGNLRQGLRKSLLRSQFRAPDVDITQEEAATWIQMFYEVLCHAIGPVAADQLLDSAIRQAGQNPGASGFDFSRWL